MSTSEANITIHKLKCYVRSKVSLQKLKMALAKGMGGSKDISQATAWESWCVNFSLFFITGTQAVLWPWCPIILKSSGLSPMGSGIALSLITVSSIVGVRYSLWSINKTRNGAVRRLFLLGMFSFSIFFSISSILILPSSNDEYFCSSGIQTLGSQGSSILQKVTEDFPSETSWVSDVTNPEVTDPNYGYGINQVIMPKPLVPKFNTKTKDLSTQPFLDTKVNNSEPIIIKVTYIDKRSTTPLPTTNEKENSKQNTIILKINLTESHSSVNVPTTDTMETNKEHNNNSNMNPDTELPKIILSDNKYLKNKKIVQSENEDTEIIPHLNNGSDFYRSEVDGTKKIKSKYVPKNYITSTANNAVLPTHLNYSLDYTKVSSANNEAQNSQFTKEQTINMVSSTTNEVQNSPFTKGQDINIVLSTTNEFQNSPSAKGEELNIVSPITNEAQNSQFTNRHYMNVVPSNTDEVQTPRIPKGRNLDISSQSLFPNTFMYPSSAVYFNRRNWKTSPTSNYGSTKPNVYNNLNEYSDISPLETKFDANPNPNFFKSKTNNFQIMGATSPQEITLNGKRRMAKREIKDSYSPIDYQQFEKESGKKIAKIDDDSKDGTSTSFGVGVATILIIATLMGGGIESAISKMWFCTKNGLCQDIEGIDAMEITISPIFQICVMGEHRKWSQITSSLWITLPTIIVGLFCQMGARMHNPLTVMGIFHGLAGFMCCFTILFIPMPYGSLRRCHSRRPLSLYLDDEVIREGLRRVFFHLWVMANGILGALPTFFTLWLLQESHVTKGEIFVSQVISITAQLFGEAFLQPAASWLSRKLNTQGVMILSSSFLWIQCILAYYIYSPWLRSGSLFLVGSSVTTMWMAIKNNAFLLGTARDQEQEAWASWISWKIGTAFGATIWTSLLEIKHIKTVQSLLLPSAIIGIIITTALFCVTVLTNTKKQSRRRIYHTLDLSNFSEEEDDEITTPDNEKEDDWLVKRAKKEGLNL